MLRGLVTVLVLLMIGSLVCIMVTSHGPGNEPRRQPHYIELSPSPEALVIFERWERLLHRLTQDKDKKTLESIWHVYRSGTPHEWGFGTDGLRPYLLADHMTTAIKSWRDLVSKQLASAKVKDTKDISAILFEKYREALCRSEVIARSPPSPIVTALLLLGQPVDGFGQEGDLIWVVAMPMLSVEDPRVVWINANTGNTLELFNPSDVPFPISWSVDIGAKIPSATDALEYGPCCYVLTFELPEIRERAAKIRTLSDALEAAAREIETSGRLLFEALIAAQEKSKFVDDWDRRGRLTINQLFVERILTPVGIAGSETSRPFWVIRVSLPYAQMFSSLSLPNLKDLTPIPCIIKPTLQELWIDAVTGQVYPMIPWERWGKSDTGKEYLPRLPKPKPPQSSIVKPSSPPTRPSVLPP